MSDPSIPYPIPTTLPQDPILREFYPEFLDRWISDLEHEWPAIRLRADQQELYRFGHTIRGSFLQFGLRDLSDVGKQIMRLSDPPEWDAVATCVDGLRRVLVIVKQDLPPMESPSP